MKSYYTHVNESTFFFFAKQPIPGGTNSGVGGPEINGSTKWIPAEVWERQGMSAQVLVLPGGIYFYLYQIHTKTKILILY